jgi:ligand-binding sensor domain-containing protein
VFLFLNTTKTNRLQKPFCLCVLLLIVFCCFAQQEKRYVFTHFSTSNGLASNIVYSIVQDRQGYMWLNTLSGLQRYDGNKFITFRNRPSDPFSVPADNFIGLIEDDRANLWVSGGGKVGIFNKHTLLYENKAVYGNTQEDPYTITFLAQDATGTAVIYVQHKGVFRYDTLKDQFMPVALFRLPNEWDPIHIKISTDRNEIVFACVPGFAVYNFKTGNINMRGHIMDSIPLLQQLAEEKVTVHIFEKGNNDIWYSTWPLVGGAPFFQYKNFKTGETKKYSLYDEFPGSGYYEIAGSLRQKNGKLWFYGKTFIIEYTGGKKPFQKINNEYRDEQSIKFDQAIMLYEDNQQNIWVCTDNGVFLFNPSAQSFFSYSLIRTDGSGIKDGPAQTALQLTNGKVLVGGWGTGMYAYDAKFNPVPLPASMSKYKEPYSVWDMKQAKDGLVWIGLQGGGIIVYDPKNGNSTIIEDSIFRLKTIRQLDEDEYGNIWFGTQSGQVVEWDKKAANGNVHKGFRTIKKNDSMYINKIYADKNGYVWAGSVTRGLFKYSTATGRLEDHITTTCPPGHRLWSNNVNDVYRFNDSILLIACGSLDVLNTNTNEITHITTEDGLPSNTVYSLQKDKSGTLWMGLAHGLCRMNLEKKIFFIYDRRDGISYDNFNPAGVVKMQDGRLIYPTDHNIVVFDPSGIKDAPTPPPAMITDFKLANTSLLVDSLTAQKKIELPFDNTSITVEFSALNYISQDKLHYHYKLDGLDKDWNETSDLNQAIYTYLPPGDYTFRVRAENSTGAPGKETILQIVVVPPFYATWWFYALVILAGIAVIYWIDKERINRLLTMQQVRTEIAGNLHEEINTTLSNINLLSEMAKIKADKDIIRSKEYIDQISDKSRKMMDAMDDMLWSLDPTNDNMERTILRMKEFAEGLQNDYEIFIQMEIDKDVPSVKAGMKVRHELFLIFKEALTQIATSGTASQCIVNIDKESSKLSLKIYDKAAMLDTANAEVMHTIADMEKRAAIINASLDIQTDHTGTSVILQMHV